MAWSDYLMTRLRTAALAVLATTVSFACGDDNPVDPAPTLSLAIVSGNSQVGAIGAELPAPLDRPGGGRGRESGGWYRQ